MTGARNLWLWTTIVVALARPDCGYAVQLTGAWASEVDKCGKVFVRRGRAGQIGFAEFSGIHGGGFIIDADQLKGKFAKCRIKTRKEDGDGLNVIASCASDVMLSNVQFVLKVVDDDTIARTFPGMEGMEVKYHRCRL